MLVEVVSRTEECIEDFDYHDALQIKMDGKDVFKVHEGETEDNNLGRNFSDVDKIPELLHKAYLAGKNGENFETTYSKSDAI